MAGIYIPNIELPKDQEIIIRIDETGEVYEYGAYPTKLYKATAVPDHGRLGDLDELASRIKAWIMHNKRALTENIEPYVSAIFYGIQETPTIIPADKEDDK